MAQRGPCPAWTRSCRRSGIVWRFQNEGFDGTHGFYLESDGKKTLLTHKIEATLSDTEGRLFWRRLEDTHARTMDALFDKLARVLKR